MDKNPYRFTGPLDPHKDDEVCIGREADLDRVISGIIKGDYWVIYGPRQSGKTTFFRQIQDRLPDIHYVNLDLVLSPIDESPFYLWLTQFIVKQIPVKNGKDMVKKSGTPLDFFHFLRELEPQPDKRIVFFCDEIEYHPLIGNFLNLWRRIYSERYNQPEFTKYSLVIGSLLDMTTLKIGSYPPFNIAKTLYLEDFSDPECRKLIEIPFKRLNITIEEAAREGLISQIGGHPQLLQHACHILVEIALKTKRPLTENDIETAIGELLFTNSAIASLKRDIQVNKELRNLVQGILLGNREMFHPYKEFSISGAGAIVADKDGYCAIRNKVYERFLVDFLGMQTRKTRRSIDSQAKDREPKAIPYGVGSFEEIRESNFYYVDKTEYLEKIETQGRYLVFIRPRRFGKTLLISMMETYYDVDKAADFAYYFKGTHVFDHPTAERNAYLILKFDFSQVKSTADQVEASFTNHVFNQAKIFISKYHRLLRVDPDKAIENLSTQNASDLLSNVLADCRRAEQKIYLVIDEYDNFANTLLSTAGRMFYERLTHGEGFFKDFFKIIKSGTSGSDIPVKRMFVTGVSPITLDDVTSGFNIGENISIDKTFNELMGFREQEVIDMLEYYRSVGKIHHRTGDLLEVMGRWYDHYRFSPEAGMKVFNPTLVLYFLKEYFKAQKIPDELFDRNVRIDYAKLRHLVMIDRQGTVETNGNFSRLKAVLETGFVVSRLEKSFQLKHLERPENFSSLLFYFGLLTIGGVDAEIKDKLILQIPNESVKKLFYEYIREVYLETEVYSLALEKYSEKIENMAFRGDWQPFFEYIAGRMQASASLRDLINGEKFIQGFLNAYLGWSELYFVHSERELNKGYADLVMEPFLAKYEGIKYAYILEIKYMPGSEREDRLLLDKLKTEAQQQLKRYSLDEKFKKAIEKTTLIKLALVFAGHELVYIGEV